MLKNPDSLCRLCISIINNYLQPLVADQNEYVHYLKNSPKNSMNLPFCDYIPECLQLKIADVPKNDPELLNHSPSKKKKSKIIITSNIVIKEASPENVLRNIDTKINTQRKRTLASTSQEQPSKIKRKRKRVYKSDSSLTSETSFHAADDSDYENFDNYIASCLQEQKEQDNFDQENICPFGLSDIDFYVEDSLEFKEDSWIIAKFASKKSIKHYLGKVLSINEKIPTVKFARKVKNSKCEKGTVFIYPDIEDVCTVQDLNDIVAVLPTPQISRRGHFIFNLDLGKYNIQ